MPLRPEVIARIKKGECVLFLGSAIHAPPPPDLGFEYPKGLRPMLAGELTDELAKDSRFVDAFPADANPSDYPLDLQRVSRCAPFAAETSSARSARKYRSPHISSMSLARYSGGNRPALRSFQAQAPVGFVRPRRLPAAATLPAPAAPTRVGWPSGPEAEGG